jgi:hypothetical protein
LGIPAALNFVSWTEPAEALKIWIKVTKDFIKKLNEAPELKNSFTSFDATHSIW